MNFEFMTIGTPLPPLSLIHIFSNQKRILETYAKQNGFSNLRWYTDDGYSGCLLYTSMVMIVRLKKVKRDSLK